MGSVRQWRFWKYFSTSALLFQRFFVKIARKYKNNENSNLTSLSHVPLSIRNSFICKCAHRWVTSEKFIQTRSKYSQFNAIFPAKFPFAKYVMRKAVFINGNYFSLFDIFHREIVQLNCILLSTPFCISDSRLAFCHRTFSRGKVRLFI